MLRSFSLHSTFTCWGLLSLLCLVAGCGGDEKPETPAEDSASNGPEAVAPKGEIEVYEYSLDEISDTGDALPPLDESRIEIAPPEDWKVGSRKSDLVVWFHEFNDPKLLPQIRVKAEDAPEGAPQEATPDDAAAYAQWVDGWLQEKIGDETLVEPIVPLVLGDNAFARFVRRGRYLSSNADRLILVTTKGGRIYTIETIVFKGGLKESRKTVLDGYAVGGSLKTPEEGGVGGFAPPGENEE